jgi:NADH-quinone oxidoreductase subunit E
LVGLQIASQRGWSAPPPDAADTVDAAPDSRSDSAAAVGAAEQADTTRAESETRVAEASEPGTEGTPKEADK